MTQVVDYYATLTGNTKEKVRLDIDRDNFMSADQVLVLVVAIVLVVLVVELAVLYSRISRRSRSRSSGSSGSSRRSRVWLDNDRDSPRSKWLEQ